MKCLTRFGVVLLVMAVICLAISPAFADGCPNGQCGTDLGTAAYAASMQRSRVFRHDPAYRGVEVIFWSSGTATPEQAMAVWRRSPGHAALLPRVRVVRCVGNYCVGR